MKLTKIFGKFDQSKTNKKIFETIDHFLDNIFWSDEEFIAGNLRKIKPEDKDVKNRYTQYHLQFHTQDEEWLANFVYHMMTYLKTANKITLDLSREVVQEYVETSPKFKQKRDEYEQAMTRGYIAIHKAEQMDFYATDEKQKEDRRDIFYDALFRDAVIKAMIGIGLSKRNVELSMEKNRDLWLNDVRRRTFNNIIDNRRVNKLEKQSSKQENIALVANIRATENELFNVWNTLRQNEYCRENEEIIKAAGIDVTAEKINNTKKKELMQYQYDLATHYREKLMACELACEKMEKERENILNQIYTAKYDPIYPVINNDNEII